MKKFKELSKTEKFSSIVFLLIMIFLAVWYILPDGPYWDFMEPGKYISSHDVTAWPLKVSGGRVYSIRGGAAYIKIKGTEYALNGLAQMQKGRKISGLVLVDEAETLRLKEALGDKYNGKKIFMSTSNLLSIALRHRK